MSLGARLIIEECDFELPQLRELKVQGFVGYSNSENRDRVETVVLTLSDGSTYSVYFSALLCHWTELSAEELAILVGDYGDARQMDYAARFGLAGARIADVRCSRDDATRVRLSLDRGVIELVEVDPQDGLSEAEIAFSPGAGR